MEHIRSKQNSFLCRRVKEKWSKMVQKLGAKLMLPLKFLWDNKLYQNFSYTRFKEPQLEGCL